MVNACFPCTTLECEERLFATFCDRGKLEEVASDDKLHSVVIIIDRHCDQEY